MAKLTGALALSGTIGGITFVKTKFGIVARSKSSLTKERVLKDPSFERSRESSSEFGRASKASRQVRSAFMYSARRAKDHSTHFRLNRLMGQVVKTDPVSRRGERCVGNGDLKLLEGFEWNSEYSFSRVFGAAYSSSIDAVTGRMEVRVAGFNPRRCLKAPAGSTHFQLRVAGMALDSADSGMKYYKDGEVLALKGKTEDMILGVDVKVEGSGLVLGVGVLFYKMEGGELYAMNEGACFMVEKVGRVDGDMGVMTNESEVEGLGAEAGVVLGDERKNVAVEGGVEAHVAWGPSFVRRTREEGGGNALGAGVLSAQVGDGVQGAAGVAWGPSFISTTREREGSNVLGAGVLSAQVGVGYRERLVLCGVLPSSGHEKGRGVMS